MTNRLVEALNTRFSHLAGECVVIYGMGQFASIMAESRDKLIFRIVGVMDKDITEGLFKGLPVVNTENVHDAARTIIIAALGSSCPLIYDRIAFLKDKGMDIYFPDGEKRSERLEIRASEYFIQVRNSLVGLINASDIVSFDVFDTLVLRKCLFPQEIFRILESRCGVTGFADKRISAEKSAFMKLGRHPTIYEIYEYMNLQSPAADDEIALEKEMIASRGDMMFFYNYAQQLEKTVILTSDMYLPEAVLSKILAGCGITGYDKIYVSCDLNKTKRNGGIWSQIRSDYPERKILHIGDNPMSDYIEQKSIVSFLIKGTVEIVDLLGFGGALTASRDYNDYLTIGTALTGLLALDLTRTNSEGRIMIDKAEDIGYCFVAPQTLGFVTWLARAASANREQSLCFCARDTYMFMDLYEKIRGLYHSPPARYLYISKRVLCGILSDSLANIKVCLAYYYARFDSKTTIKEAVYRLFGVSLPDDEFTMLSVKEVDPDILFSRISESYFGLFRKNAETERKNFYKYLKRYKIDLHRVAMVDYICGQSVQLAKNLFSGNFYLYGLTETSLCENTDIHAWLEKLESPQLPYYYVMKYSQFGEAIYSSPEGTCLMFNEYGKPVLDNEKIDFSIHHAIYQGVESFSADGIYPVSCETADRIFGALFSGNYYFAHAIKGLSWSSYTANKGGTLI